MRPKETSALQRSPDSESERNEADCLLGEFRALLRRVGLPALGTVPGQPFWTVPLDTPTALSQFLQNYFSGLLLPCELPAIATACGHARRGELRELLAQDIQLAGPLLATPFAEPSRQMGALQLARLRPLRDSRIVQRYLSAVASGQAHGWHTLVYGVTMAVFSLPLRQGLLYYSQETLSVLASAAGRSRNFPQAERDEIIASLFAQIPEAVEAALARYETCVRPNLQGETLVRQAGI